MTEEAEMLDPARSVSHWLVDLVVAFPSFSLTLNCYFVGMLKLLKAQERLLLKSLVLP